MPEDPSELLNSPIRYYIRRHRKTVTLGLLCLLVTNALETLVPWMVGRTLDQITAEARLEAVARWIAGLFVVLVFLSLFRYLWRVFWATFHHTAAEQLRNRVFEHMVLLGPSFYRPRKIGQLLSFIANDTNSFRMGIGPGLLVLFDGLFLICLILPMMISISWTWTWQTLILMPFVPFTVQWILEHLHLEYHHRQERFADMSGSAQEIVSGIRTIKSFARENEQTREFNVHSQRFREVCDRVAWWDAIFGPSLELPVALGAVLLLLLGAPRVADGSVTIGQFFTFYQYIQRMIWPMSAIGIGLGQVQEARGAFRRLAEVFGFAPDVPDHGDIALDRFETLEVRNLSFTYPGTSVQALKNISFQMRRGQSLGIVGLTGAGKSTLIELLTRQYPVPPGTILVNGVSVERIRLTSLRRLFVVAPQEAFLFSRRVADNLALGLSQWDPEDLTEAAAQVRLDQEIETWPGGYEALVGERGVNLSGGQKQRMALARAVARDADLVILDDSLSAVDAKTEAEILHRLRDRLSGATSIVASHRLASVRAADQILVLHHGQLEAIGRHEELLGASATYRELHHMQSEGASHE